MLKTPDSPQLELRATTNEAVNLEPEDEIAGENTESGFTKNGHRPFFITVIYPKKNAIKKCYSREKVQIDAL